MKRSYSYTPGGSQNVRPKKKAKTFKVATYSKTPLAMDHKLLRQSQSAVLRYYGYSLHGQTSTEPGFHVYSVGGCYDPDITGVGHQPRGYDQLMTMYENYQVDEATIEVTYCRGTPSTWSSVNGAPVTCMLNLEQSSAASLNTIEDWAESRFHQQKVWIPGTTAPTLRMTVKPYEYFGLPKRGEADLLGQQGANPSKDCFWHVGVIGSDNTTDAADMTITVRITYKVNLTNPKDPSIS